MAEQKTDQKPELPGYLASLPKRIELDPVSEGTLQELSQRIAALSSQMKVLEESINTLVTNAFRYNVDGVDPSLLAAYNLFRAEEGFVLRQGHELQQLILDGKLPRNVPK